MARLSGQLGLQLFFTSLQFLWRGVMTRQEICVGHLPDLALAYHGQLIPYML